jgi:hypothetical protein
MIRDLIEHPGTIITVAVGVVSQFATLPLVDPLISVILQQSGALFTAASITGFTIAPQVEWLPVDIIQTLAIVVGALFVLTQLAKVGRAAKKQFMEE